MKKILVLALISSVFLASCGKKLPDNTFTVFEIGSCSDYFDYLAAPIESGSDRQAGTVYGIECRGVMDFRDTGPLPYGFLVQTENHGEKRIGLHVIGEDNDRMLETFHGQELTVSGELRIQTIDPNGAGLFAKEVDIKVVPAF